MVTLNGKVRYPENIIEELSSKVKTFKVDGTKKAIELGLDKVMNIIMLGATVKALKLEHLNFEEAIKNQVKPKFIDMNLEAYNIGLKQVML